MYEKFKSFPEVKQLIQDSAEVSKIFSNQNTFTYCTWLVDEEETWNGKT